MVFLREDESILTVRESRRQVSGEDIAWAQVPGLDEVRGAEINRFVSLGCGHRAQRRGADSEPRSLTVASRHLSIGSTPKLQFLIYTHTFTFNYRNICIEEY